MDNLTQRFDALVKEVKSDLRKIKVPFDETVPIRLNSNLKSTAGYCRYTSFKAIDVSINKKMFETENESFMKNVIAHELLHSSGQCLKCGHKGLWKYYANVVNCSDLGYNIERCYRYVDIKGSYRKPKPIKYQIVCEYCGMQINYRSKSKHVKRLLDGEKAICGNCNKSLLTVRTVG